jgi:hypothetical protein
MLRATLVEGVGKRWLEVERYVWTKNEWRWRSVGRIGFGNLPDQEEDIYEQAALLSELLSEWLNLEDSDHAVYWLHI